MAQNQPTGGGDDLDSVLAELSGPLRRLADAAGRSAGGLGGALPHRPENWADKLAHHIRRYAPLYAIGTIWALMIILVPTVNDGGGPTDQAGQITGGNQRASQSPVVSGTTSGGRATSSPGTTGATNAAATSGDGGGGAQAAAATNADGDGEPAEASGGGGSVGAAGAGSEPFPWLQEGTTRGGHECTEGVRQIPWSEYAAPCRPEFTADNGGETYPGVTEDTIKFVIRVSGDAGGPNQQTVDQINQAAGRATASEAVSLFMKYADHFNEVFELYGREVVFERYESSSSNRTDEAQSKGREAACADATEIAERGAFAVIAHSDSIGETEPFSDCAAQRGLMIPIGAFYFPEEWYANRWHPFVWNVFMECERIGKDIAEYIGKRLWGKNAKWAGDHHSDLQTYTEQDRVLGIYVPDNDGYQRCIDLSERTLERDYGAHVESRYNYQLDVSRFPDQASQAAIQFKSDGVTTLVNACDAISTLFLTQNAKQQDWWPEWLMIGVAQQDTAGRARDYDQDEVDGHLFGMSQRGSDEKMRGEDGEAAKTWREMGGSWPPPAGFAYIYFYAIHVFSMLQAAGPDLTPENIDRAMHALPPGGGSEADFGTWSFHDDHTAIDDSREIFWDGTAEAWDGQQGAYLETYGGERFGTGHWPAEDPPVYPDGHP